MPDDTDAIEVSDRYRIGAEIGRGSLGVVYRVEDLRDGGEVAVKILSQSPFWRRSAELFVREIRFVMPLRHPHIVPVIDAGKAQDGPYYVMPLVAGESLRSRLKRERMLPISEALSLAADVASALDYAHQHHLVHRDLKPEDILLQDGRALVTDFGISRVLEADGDSEGLTGFPAYLSPEQSMGGQASERSDIYSLGCILFEMLTGSPPVRVPIQKHMSWDIDGVRVLRSDVPAWVERILERAMQLNPARRFSSAAEMKEALLQAIHRLSQPVPTWRQPIAFLRAALTR